MVTPLIASAALNPVNSTLIAVALVPIGQAFGAGPAQTAWLVSALYLATAIGQPVVGVLVDRLGARRVLIAGAAAVGVAGAAGVAGLSLGWLIGVRVLLGIGTCAGFPAAMAVLRRHAEATGQGTPARVLSVLGLSAQSTMVIGPTLGGALIGLAGWRAIFAVNIPLAAIAIGFALLWVPRDDPAPAAERDRLDLPGIALFSAMLLALMVFLMDPSPADAWLLAAAAALAAGFARVELRAPRPFIDLRMLRRHGAMLRTYLRQALSFLAIYSVLFGYVQWLESTRGLSESAAGLLLLPMSVIAVAGSSLSGSQRGLRARLVGGAAALLAGSCLLMVADAGTSGWALVAIAALFGVGQGTASVSNQTALFGQAPADAMGMASGLFRSAQYLGAIAATTLIALCYGPHASSAGLHALGTALLVITLLLLVITLVDREIRPGPGVASAGGEAQDGTRDTQAATARRR